MWFLTALPDQWQNGMLFLRVIGVTQGQKSLSLYDLEES